MAVYNQNQPVSASDAAGASFAKQKGMDWGVMNQIDRNSYARQAITQQGQLGGSRAPEPSFGFMPQPGRPAPKPPIEGRGFGSLPTGPNIPEQQRFLPPKTGPNIPEQQRFMPMPIGPGRTGAPQTMESLMQRRYQNYGLEQRQRQQAEMLRRRRQQLMDTMTQRTSY